MSTAVHVPRARSSSIRYIALIQAFFAAVAQVLEYLAPAPAADAAPILSLSSSPSAPAPVVENIASIPAVYAAPALVAEYIALHQQCTLHLHLRWSQRAGTSSVRCTCAYCGAHRASTSCLTQRSFLESSSHVRRRLLASRCGEQRSPVSLLVDTLHSCYKVSITKLTHRQLLCSPRTVGNAPHQGTCADLKKRVFSCCICARR